VTISVIVPAFNEERVLPETLAAISAASAALVAAGFSWELIVCDNNSTDRTAAIGRDAGARVVFEPVNQIGRARNTGAAAATGDWLIFVDADSRPSSELFADVAREIRSGRTLAGGCRVVFDHSPWIVRAMVAFWNVMSRTLGWAAGSFIFCEARAFRAIGGFSQVLYAAEEIDLFRRLKRLARREGRAIRILTAHPLVTSGRKAELYSNGEFFRFQLKTVLTLGRNLRSSEGCDFWYDGRR
jgi:glycosyltransferase involved in cell wall biosynthesis